MMDIWDIHTHRECSNAIINVAPSLFVPGKGRFYSVGIHPWSLKDGYRDEWGLLQEVAQDSQVLAIGEAGLDKLVSADMFLQEEVFELQIALAGRLGKPLLIHAVRSSNELIRLKKKHCPQVPWIVHGFRGNERVASQLVEQGFYLSFGEKYQPEALRAVPLERLFMETDESLSDILSLYRNAAECLRVPFEQFSGEIRQNIKDVFFRG